MFRLTHFTRPLARCLAWAMLAAALWPAASRAWVRAQGPDTEVCSAQGARWVKLNPASDDVPASGGQSGHCPACPAPAHDDLAPALARAHGLAPSVPARAAPERPDAERSPAPWRLARSRGPP